MENKKLSSYFYLKNKNRNLALDFLKEMNKNILNKTIEQMKLLELYGIDTKKVSVKKFQNDIWKIRTKDSSNNVRFFFYIIENKIIYIYGFFKSTQKTPEGKKITINNLKTELVNLSKQNDFESYLEKIDWEKINL